MKRGHSDGSRQLSFAERAAIACANDASSQPERQRVELESEEYDATRTPLKRRSSAPVPTPGSARIVVEIEDLDDDDDVPEPEYEVSFPSSQHLVTAVAPARAVTERVSGEEKKKEAAHRDEATTKQEGKGKEEAVEELVAVAAMEEDDEYPGWNSSEQIEEAEQPREEEEEEEDDDDDDDDEIGGMQEESDRHDDEDDRDETNPLYNGKHVAEKNALVQAAADQFDLWSNILSQNFSVLLAGVGSKYELLHRFCEKKMSKLLPCIVVKGFTCHTKGTELCSILVDNLARELDCVVHAINKLKPIEKWKSIALQLSDRGLGVSSDEEGDEELLVDCEEVKMQTDDSYYNSQEMRPGVISSGPEKKETGKRSRRKQVCVVLHSIDGLELRSPELQSLLCDIASTPEVQLIASIDDVNMPKMWSKEMLERFRWWWVSVHTFQLYSTEDTMAKIATQKAHVETSDEKVERLLMVMSSLSEKHQMVTLALCEKQLSMLEAGAKRGDVWVSMAEWSKADGMENIAFQRVTQTLLKELMQGEQLEQKAKTVECYRLTNMTMDELKHVRIQLADMISSRK